MRHDVPARYKWDPANPVLCETLIQYLVGEMAGAKEPLLFCRLSRESYLVDPKQRDALWNEIEKLLLLNKGNDRKYEGTDDVVVTARFSGAEFEEAAPTLFEYFSELLILVPKEICGWDEFLRVFQKGHPAHQLKKVKAMCRALVLISTDEGLVQIYT